MITRYSIGLAAIMLSAQTWQQLPGTALHPLCPPNGFNNGVTLNGVTQSYYYFSGLCYNVTANDSGGMADLLGNMMIIWGGGHEGSSGNELYGLNLNTKTSQRLNDPSIFNSSQPSTAETYLSDGLPVARHTAGGLVWLPLTDEMFAFGGYNLGGSAMRKTWRLGLSSLLWTDMTKQPGYSTGYDPTKYSPSTNGDHCSYDGNSQSVICEDGSNLMLLRYDPTANKWKVLTTYSTLCHGLPYCNSGLGIGVVVDPVNQLFIMIGNSAQSQPASGHFIVWVVSIAPGSNFKTQDWTSYFANCGSINTYPVYSLATGMNVPNPGLTFNPNLSQVVGYPWDGTTLYFFDFAAKTCSTQTYAGSVPPSNLAPPNGTFGRFAYFPALNEYVLVNNMFNNASVLEVQ